jgi:uncharacterized protein YndB with AHSA1/START domain
VRPTDIGALAVGGALARRRGRLARQVSAPVVDPHEQMQRAVGRDHIGVAIAIDVGDDNRRERTGRIVDRRGEAVGQTAARGDRHADRKQQLRHERSTLTTAALRNRQCASDDQKIILDVDPPLPPSSARRFESNPGGPAASLRRERTNRVSPPLAFACRLVHNATQRLHMTTSVTDRIEKTIVLRAARARVWRALTDPKEFGDWFGMRFDDPFVPGGRVRATVVGTTVDPEVAKAQQQHAGVRFEIHIERIEPQRLFSFRWHPGAVDPSIDYSKEPTTLVEFALAEAAGGVQLTVTESGFDRIPLARRAAAFSGNEQGWAVVVTLIDRYLANDAA